MKPPQNNNDLQHLRSWIRQKYIDKHWCDNMMVEVGIIPNRHQSVVAVPMVIRINKLLREILCPG